MAQPRDDLGMFAPRTTRRTIDRVELRVKLARLDIDQAELARRIDYHPTGLSRILSGATGVTDRFVDALTGVFGAEFVAGIITEQPVDDTLTASV